MILKKTIWLLFSLCALLFFPYYSVFADFQKTKIAVLDFELRGDDFKTTGMGEIVAEWFTTTLVKDGRFEVIERALLQKIIEEQKLGLTGLVDEETSTQLGKILGVKTIITGSVLQIGKKIEVNARIINVKTGSIIAAENIQGDSNENLQHLVADLTARIVKNFPLTGYIVKKKNKSVLIDLGATSGLQIGMEFIVFKEGEVIKHPKTGEVLEVEQIQTGQIQITKIRTNVANAKILREEKDQHILYGQLVQSVRKPVVLKKKKQIVPKKSKTKTNTKKLSKQIEKTPPKSYVRSEFPQGARDNLSSGGQAPPVVSIPTGNYMMGGFRFSEKPKHYVNIDKSVFFMTTEVTFNDYTKFCRDTGHPMPDDFSWGQGDRPVINVSWNDTKAYAVWLSEQTGLYYRLPFENEWEWAARSGSDILHSWGNSFEKDKTNCKKCGSKWDNRQTAPTRSFPPNTFGLHDMSGNVWEWVQDCWVENYINSPDNQSAREYTGRCGNYTIRGGAWNSSRKQITTSSRLGVWANTKSNYIGFRLVRDPSVSPAQNRSGASSPSPSLNPTMIDDDEDWDTPSTQKSSKKNKGLHSSSSDR